MGDLFRLCRERVSAEDAARRYGIQVGRGGRALCPFHDDRHPSMSFRRGYFRCWSCGERGSAIDLTAGLFGLTPLEAVRKLNEDFQLSLPLDRSPTPAEREQTRHEEELRVLRDWFLEWREKELTRICSALRVGNLALKRSPVTWTEAETLAVKTGERLDRYEELLEQGTREEQMDVFMRREEVEKLCTKILNDTRTPCARA